MKLSNLRINVLLISSFWGQKGKRTVSTLRSSNNQSGMMFSSSASGIVVKSRITDSMNLLWKPTSKNFFLIRFFSFSKSDAILRALCSSPLIAFRLYRFGTLDDQKTGRFPGFCVTSSWRMDQLIDLLLNKYLTLLWPTPAIFLSQSPSLCWGVWEIYSIWKHGNFTRE